MSTPRAANENATKTIPRGCFTSAPAKDDHFARSHNTDCRKFLNHDATTAPASGDFLADLVDKSARHIELKIVERFGHSPSEPSGVSLGLGPDCLRPCLAIVGERSGKRPIRVRAASGARYKPEMSPGRCDRPGLVIYYIRRRTPPPGTAARNLPPLAFFFAFGSGAERIVSDVPLRTVALGRTSERRSPVSEPTPGHFSLLPAGANDFASSAANVINFKWEVQVREVQGRKRGVDLQALIK
ncbi:hypothetical protein ZHAS_00018549 [Anopheles sinensis]|uniref:Uncharacterized protein n=1 Tax=Anopheles sinensis TaxID=74873 RepID=A0A084WJW6_ANOSI|nr:hypothetical protein ZHAS_00018549 [Anopheles sinensis]